MTANITDYMAEFEKQQLDKEAQLKILRPKIREKLLSLRVKHASCSYSGYGDSGDVEDVTLTVQDGIPPLDAMTITDVASLVGPELTHLTHSHNNLREVLAEFFWATAYSLYPGFENNDGGQGEFTWDLVSDKLELDHGNNWTETSHTVTEIDQ